MSSRPRRAVLMVVDGLRADMVTPEHVPATRAEQLDMSLGDLLNECGVESHG